MGTGHYRARRFRARRFKMFLPHFSRIQLPPDMAADQALVLETILNLLPACVVVQRTRCHGPQPSPMYVQAMWEIDSPLKQVPHSMAR
jgi:pre-mRNA-splicing helicase BRR2